MNYSYLCLAISALALVALMTLCLAEAPEINEPDDVDYRAD